MDSPLLSSGNIQKRPPVGKPRILDDIYRVIPTFKVFQIHFREDQVAALDPAFEPYDNSKNIRAREMEYRVFLDNFESGTVAKAAEYVGFVSWKFRAKTKIEGDRFISWARSSPGADVYFINPFPDTILWRNVWLQGEQYHPGLLAFTQKAMDRAGYKLDLKSMKNDSSNTAYCNYWVGNQKFWSAYMEFTKPLYDYLTEEATDEEKRFLWARADKKIDASFFPFIFERMFSTFLVVHKNIRSHAYTYDAPGISNHPMTREARMFLNSLYWAQARKLSAAEPALRATFQAIRQVKRYLKDS